MGGVVTTVIISGWVVGGVGPVRKAGWKVGGVPISNVRRSAGWGRKPHHNPPMPMSDQDRPENSLV